MICQKGHMNYAFLSFTYPLTLTFPVLDSMLEMPESHTIDCQEADHGSLNAGRYISVLIPPKGKQ